MFFSPKVQSLLLFSAIVVVKHLSIKDAKYNINTCKIWISKCLGSKIKNHSCFRARSAYDIFQVFYFFIILNKIDFHLLSNQHKPSLQSTEKIVTLLHSSYFHISNYFSEINTT